MFIDPFGDMGAWLASRGLEFGYPPIEGVTADLLLVTHEHRDHNAVEAIDGNPVVLRSTAGTLASPVGEVVAVASEHDDVAGTTRGPNTIFRFTLDGVRICHFGDFGQSALRPEQREAIGEVDVLLLPVGDGPTVGGETGRRGRARAAARGSWCRTTTAPRRSASSTRPTRSSTRSARASNASDGPELEVDQYLGTAEQPIVALPALPTRG